MSAKIETLTDEQWQMMHAAKANALAFGRSTEPADKPTAESAITLFDLPAGIYAVTFQRAFAEELRRVQD